jgi:beta-glucosidase
MPYYGIPENQTSENVGMAFNKEIITDLLREKYGFEGIVCSDWMICEPIKLFGLFKMMDSTSWGVENLSILERYQKALDAGVDQFGGQFQTHRILQLIKAGLISEERIDRSVRRLLKLKFQLGLFDNPYVDETSVKSICACDKFVSQGNLAQRKSVVLLKNNNDQGVPILPLKGRPKVYVENVEPTTINMYADLVDQPDEADFAILRLRTPWRPMGKGFLERMFHQGDLDFEEEEKNRILNILDTVPTIVDIYLERAAVIPDIAERCNALLATFNVADDAVLDVIFGGFNPSGKLPIELPRSMDSVRSQREDVPRDSAEPLYPFGAGLSYN